MAVFISYSHEDAGFVDKLAAHLIKAKAHVWVDRWELSVGDSLVRRIEEEIEKATALVVVLSRASVESEWCRKELTAGLVRELEERKVLVLPLLVEDCQVPLFLRDKKYADFRTDFDAGLLLIREALARVTTDTLGRLDEAGGHVDWSTEWSLDENGSVVIHLTAVDLATGQPFTTLSLIDIQLNAIASERHRAFVDVGCEPFARQLILESLSSLDLMDDLFVILEDATPVRKTIHMTDSTAGLGFEVRVMCRRLGQDTGRDIVLDLGKQIRGMAAQGRQTLPPPPPEKKDAVRRILLKYRSDLPFQGPH